MSDNEGSRPPVAAVGADGTVDLTLAEPAASRPQKPLRRAAESMSIRWGSLELDPAQKLPRLYHSWLMVLQGDSAGAMIEARRAQEIEPLSPLVNAGTAHTLFLARRYDQAVTECEKSLEVDPNFIFAIHVMGMCRALQSRLTEAIEIGERTVLMSGRAPFYLGVLGHYYARAARAARCATFLKSSRAWLTHGTFRRIASSTSIQGRTTSTEHSSGRPKPMTTGRRPSTITRLSSRTSTPILVTPPSCGA